MSKPPLWEVMHQGFWKCPKENWRLSSAYMIRALRDWLVPEEVEPPVGEGEPWPRAYQQRSDAMWEQRQLLRTLLTDEADRAERSH